MNVNSIRRRKAELEEFSIYAKPDLLMFTETKVDASIASSEFLPEEFIGNIRRDRTLDGGGVMIAARKDLDITGLEVCNFAIILVNQCGRSSLLRATAPS